MSMAATSGSFDCRQRLTLSDFLTGYLVITYNY